MAKGKFDEMVGELVDGFMAREAAEAVLDKAEGRAELDVNCNGETAKGHLRYEGNGGGYLYGAYILLREAKNNTSTHDIDCLLKIIKCIDDILKDTDRKEWKEEKNPETEKTAD